MNNFHMREGKVEFRWKRWRNKKRQEVSSCLMVLFSGAVILGAGGVALAGPTGGQVTGGQGTITTPNGTTTNINQQSNVLNINWQDFSIGAGETVNFYQPGSTSVAINRVVGGVPSRRRPSRSGVGHRRRGRDDESAPDWAPADAEGDGRPYRNARQARRGRRRGRGLAGARRHAQGG